MFCTFFKPSQLSDDQLAFNVWCCPPKQFPCIRWHSRSPGWCALCMYQHKIPAYPICKCISNSAPKFSQERNWRKIPMSSAGLFGLLLMNVSKASFMAFTNFSFLRKQTSIIWSTLSLKSRSSWTMVLSFSGLITMVLPNACKIKHIFQLAWIMNLNDKSSKILSYLCNVLFLVLILFQ